MSNGAPKDPRMAVFRVAVILVILGIVGAVAYYKYQQRNAPPDGRVALAQCLTDKGAKMYGAYWCPHCQAQKKDFAPEAFKKINYVECASPANAQQQTQACIDAKIESYPTWEFKDGSRVTGEQELKTLAEKSGCEYAP